MGLSICVTLLQTVNEVLGCASAILIVGGEGLITEKIPYEISKSWDFAKDFRISGKISRFH